MSIVVYGSATDASNFSPFSRDILEQAGQDAIRYGLAAICPENVLKAIAQIHVPIKTSIVLSQCLNTVELVTKIDRGLSKKSNPSMPGKIFLSKECVAILSRALQEAINDKSPHINTEHILLAIAHNPSSSAGMYLSFFGVTYDMLKNKLSMIPVTKSVDMPSMAASTNPPANTATKTSDTTSTVNTSCSPNCGCTDGATNIKKVLNDVVSNIAKNAKNVAKSVVSKGKTIKIEAEERAKWLGILDEAIVLSKVSGLAVPSAFVEISLKNNEVVTSAIKDQIRQESLIDAAEAVMRMS